MQAILEGDYDTFVAVIEKIRPTIGQSGKIAVAQQSGLCSNCCYNGASLALQGPQDRPRESTNHECN